MNTQTISGEMPRAFPYADAKFQKNVHYVHFFVLT